MLHFETIDKATLALLEAIQRLDVFRNFRLVGGTALALQIGHRKSIDLDFFGPDDFSEINFPVSLQDLGHRKVLLDSSAIKIFTINGIKVDFVQYPYPWLSEAYKEGQLVLAKPTDIAAMKLSAICNRGSKKDFYDLYFLLDQYSLSDLLGFYKKKFSDASPFLVLKSLTYFEDAETDDDPLMLRPLAWDEVKNRILAAHSDFLNQ